MSKSTRILFAASCVLLVYFVYLIGETVTMQSNQILVYVAPFYKDMSHENMSVAIHQFGLATLVSWVLWAVQFLRDGQKGVEERKQPLVLVDENN